MHRLLRERPPLARLKERAAYPWVIVGTVCIGAFMGQLDTSIVSLVLPELELQFNASLNNVQWVAIIYLLVLTALLTPLGRIADELGRKALYTGGFLFIVGSALCGFAPKLWTWVAARAVQALGGAMLQANSVALITTAVQREKLGRAIGVQATAQALGLAIRRWCGAVHPIEQCQHHGGSAVHAPRCRRRAAQHDARPRGESWRRAGGGRHDVARGRAHAPGTTHARAAGLSPCDRGPAVVGDRRRRAVAGPSREAQRQSCGGHGPV
ncbi:MAG TPA: MFS transporter [Burkholderiales bacterium]|nr:MFS transporter [Burkholderiales bacterium]